MLNDDELIEQIKKGNDQAAEELINRYYKSILRYCKWHCSSLEKAEDLTQDTFVKALLSLAEGHGNIKAWLYMVARNLYLNHRKSEKRNISWDEVQYQEDIAGDSLLAEIICSEKYKLLFQGINQLSANKREILQLQYFSGLTQKEIAAILGLSDANVRVLALRAKRELKCFLEENGYDFS